ncbi:MAG TPA: DUF3090 domain-containing protein [Acidimicrobiales bacterium]
MGDRFELGDVEVFTAGAVGQPGQRTFFLQARGAAGTVSVKCEKQQVAALAEHLQRLLRDLAAPADQPHPSTLEITAPDEAAFVLGPIGVAVDGANDRIVLQLEEMVATDEEGDPLPGAEEDKGMVRAHLTRGQAKAFADRALELVAAGRPLCRWCARPIDPDGHACPRMN